MELTYHGLSCMRLRGREATVVIDPPQVALPGLARATPDIVVRTEGGPSSSDDLVAVLRPDAPLGLDELQARSGRSPGELLARLAELELECRVRRLPGGLFVRR